MDELSVVCNCEATPILVCKNDISAHLQLERTHNFINIYSEINQETRISTIQLFSQIKSQIKSLKLKVIHEESSLIQKIHSSTENTLEKLKKYDKKLAKIISEISSLKAIDNSKPLSFIETLLSNDISLIPKIRPPKLCINEIDTQNINDLFNLELAEEAFDYNEHYRPTSRVIKFVCNVMRNRIAIFDPKSLKLNKINFRWKKALSVDGIGCLMPNGRLFYSRKDSWLIINPIGKSREIPGYKPSTTAGAIYVDEKIYLFGGYTNSAAKFLISESRWISLSKCSISIKLHTTCAIFKNKILIASKSETPIYYDIIADSYSEILSEKLLSNTSKLFFVKNEKVLLFEFSKFIYESNDNLMTWNKIGDCSIIPHYSTLAGYPTWYNDAIYIVVTDYVYSFNLKTNLMEKVAPIKHSLLNRYKYSG